jgi:hypothetical protein
MPASLLVTILCTFAATAPSDDLLPLLADLARRSAYGIHGAERAAFLVRDGDGGVRCVLWPFVGESRSASHRGPLPPGTIAVAHTHPKCCRSLSPHDYREAERLGITVMAVSRDALHVATPGAPRVAVRRGIDWRRHLDEQRRCR